MQVVVLELTHMVVKWRHCYFKVTASCEIASESIKGLLEVYFKIQKSSCEQEKYSIIRVRVG